MLTSPKDENKRKKALARRRIMRRGYSRRDDRRWGGEYTDSIEVIPNVEHAEDEEKGVEEGAGE
jgi:hypothetical protein